MKKLPILYTNSFDKKIDNSLEYITLNNNNNNNDNDKRNVSKYDINRKIDNIFKSSNYIYKVKVEITLKDKIIIENIIGRTNNKLITYNNEIINIIDILDIRELS